MQDASKPLAPLAYILRPSAINEFIGQEHIIGKGKPLQIMIESKEIPSSLIFWGPPGSGKTTLARLLAKSCNAEFIEMSAVMAGKADIERAVNRAKLLNKKTILFLDEIHRFNKAQQDTLLPYVEKGTLTLIGATTENPSFSVISALLSRSRVFVLNQLSEQEISKILANASNKKEIKENNIVISPEIIKLISQLSNGDARSALNILELALHLAKRTNSNILNSQNILDAAQKSHLRYDKQGEEHYNIISALHKSMRDSDIDASIYWTMRMAEAGEDPLYIIRRMIRFASEDIGNADPNALMMATSAKQAIEHLGYPECNTALVQTAIYLAQAPKSNAVYGAVLKAQEEIQKSGNLPVPLHLRNAPTILMKELNYGKGYKYAHDYENAKIEQEHFPPELKGKKLYTPKHENEKRK